MTDEERAGEIANRYLLGKHANLAAQDIAAAMSAARREEREACLADIAIEEELDGEPSEEEFAGMRAAGFVATMRATVRVTKKNIAERINQRGTAASAIRSPERRGDDV